MSENRTVTPFADDDVEMVTMPDCLTVIREINRKAAHQIIVDCIHDEAEGGKSHLERLSDIAIPTLAHREDWLDGDNSSYEEYLTGMRKLLFAFQDLLVDAGASSYAQDLWVEENT